MTPREIENRIRTLSQRLPYCHMHGQDPQPLEDEIAELKARLRQLGGANGGEKRDANDQTGGQYR